MSTWLPCEAMHFSAHTWDFCMHLNWHTLQYGFNVTLQNKNPNIFKHKTDPAIYSSKRHHKLNMNNLCKRFDGFHKRPTFNSWKSCNHVYTGSVIFCTFQRYMVTKEANSKLTKNNSEVQVLQSEIALLMSTESKPCCCIPVAWAAKQ